MSFCPKCKEKVFVKNGMVKGKQRYKCKSCGYQWTQFDYRKVSLDKRKIAVALYNYGLSYRTIARMFFRLSPNTVCRWVHNTRDTAEIEMDKLLEFVRERKNAWGQGPWAQRQIDAFLSANSENQTAKEKPD